MSCVNQKLDVKSLQEKFVDEETERKSIGMEVSTNYEGLKIYFISLFQDVVKILKDTIRLIDPVGKGDHFERSLTYNVSGGKLSRGLSTVYAFVEFAPKSSLTRANIKLAGYLGWCIELMHTGCFMIDDVVDGGIIRRNKTCWYKLEGLDGANDAFTFYAILFQLLKIHFNHLQCYLKLLHMFLDKTFASTLGQHMDARTSNKDVLNFNMEHVKYCAYNKMSYYSIYMPIAGAMYLAGYPDEQCEHANEILLDIGYLAAVQDSFLDLYVEPDVKGKIGSDIKNGRCTWFVVNFLQHANEEQKVELKMNFGKKDDASAQRVKELYEELSLKEMYMKWEEEFYMDLKGRIDNSNEVPKNLCHYIIDKLYRRKV